MNEAEYQMAAQFWAVYFAVVVVWIVVVAVVIGVRAAVHGADDVDEIMWLAHLMAGFVWPLALACYAAYWTTRAVLWARKNGGAE